MGLGFPTVTSSYNRLWSVGPSGDMSGKLISAKQLQLEREQYKESLREYPVGAEVEKLLRQVHTFVLRRNTACTRWQS